MSQSYSNPQGSGNRGSDILATTYGGFSFSGGTIWLPSLFDGALSNTVYATSQTVSGKGFIFWFAAAPRIIDAIKLKKSDFGALGDATFDIEGFDGTAWHTLSAGVSVAATPSTEIEYTFTNTTAYWAYRFKGVSGSMVTASYIQEVEFRIDSASVPAPSGTYWDAAHKTTDVGLYWNALVAHNGSFAFAGVRALNEKTVASGGKFYFEMYVDLLSDSRERIGIAGSGWTVGANDTSNLATIDQTGTVVNGGSAGATPQGHWVGVAVDLDNKKIWFTYDGSTWFGAAAGTPNPNTLTAGAAFNAGMASSTVVHIAAALVGIDSKVELNVGGKAYAHSIPTGFTSWDVQVATGSPPVPIININ